LSDLWPIFGRKRGPFNRPVSPSLLRDGTLEAELRPMVTGNPAQIAPIATEGANA